ncbi:MAG: 50S ribosomal protein L6 [Candidatus Doudnabacteria bacterium]|nr:50S ribosomal protein L6 [Candidatus Doudnabacteria bacterium]
MSRVGKKAVSIPNGVTVDLKGNRLKIKGPKGELSLDVHPKVKLNQEAGEIVLNVQRSNNKLERSLWGLSRSLVNNMVLGVTEGFSKSLEVNGVGYKAQVSGKKLVLNLGYSHTIEMEVPAGLEVKVEKNIIVVTGADKQAVGEFAAVIRQKRAPEPYKGKGIKYIDEVIRRKAGKVVKAVGGGA